MYNFSPNKRKSYCQNGSEFSYVIIRYTKLNGHLNNDKIFRQSKINRTTDLWTPSCHNNYLNMLTSMFNALVWL